MNADHSMTDCFIQTEASVVGPFNEVQMREAALANIIAKDAVLSADPNGPWHAASEIGYFNEKGVAIPHAKGVVVPECHVQGMPGAFQGPFKLRELIGFAARGMLPPDAKLQFVDDVQLSDRGHSDPAKPAEQPVADWIPVSSIRILDETLSGRLVKVRPDGKLVLRSSLHENPLPEDARAPIELAQSADRGDRTAYVAPIAEVDPEFEAEQIQQAELTGLARQQAKEEKASAKAVKSKAEDKDAKERVRPARKASLQVAMGRTSRLLPQRLVFSLLCLFLVAASVSVWNQMGIREPIVEVSGVLTYQGMPVPDMLLTFQPETGRPSWGQTDSSGKFTLNYSRSIPKGALIARHKVWLTRGSGMPSTDVSPVQYAEQLASDQAHQVGEIPSEYFSQRSTTIEIQITESTDDLKIELP